MTSSLRPCLYCENPTNPHTREHILQQGFGTNWVLKEDVCSECNTQKFSHLDSELLRLAHAYIYMDHPDRLSRRTILQEGHKLWFDDQAGLWISLQVRQDGKRAFFPQLIFLNEREFCFLPIGANNKTFLELIKSELNHPEKLMIKDQLVGSQPEDLPEVQPALIRSKENAYYIRAVLQEDVNWIKGMIYSRSFDAIPGEEKKLGPFPQPMPVQIETYLNEDYIKRALAKSALNFLCAAVGPEVARHECFSELRRFVRGEYPVAPDEFVMPLWDRDRDQHSDNFCSLFSREGHHTLVLCEMEGFPLVLFLLYSRPFARVCLLKEPHTSILGTLVSHVAFFDYKSKTHTLLTLEDYIRSDFCDLIS